jgi:transglutaminase-like putative cysteine protease
MDGFVRRIPGLVALALLVTSGGTQAGSVKNDEVKRGPVPSWILAPPTPSETAAPPQAPLRTILIDEQIRMGPSGYEHYLHRRLKVLKPEALKVGNVSFEWKPDAGDLTVHAVRIIRPGATIDVLQQAQFRVVRQEANLERAVLNGEISANLQVPGLQVGDELEIISTSRYRDPTLGDRFSGGKQFPLAGMPGVFRYRLVWPAKLDLNVRTTSDLPRLAPRAVGSGREVSIELRDPEPSPAARGAPPRFAHRRAIEFSDYGSWSAVSARLAPLYRDAATLAPGSDLHREVVRIARASQDPVEQAAMALQLVQQQIRYVYVGLNDGNLKPATADETWSRRFGDCKGKGALLLALLQELKIEAEAVAVHTKTLGDGYEQRLPSPGLFDHLIVRAKIGGKWIYLDGTRPADRKLTNLPLVRYRTVLPLKVDGAELEAIAPTPSALPIVTTLIDFDASKGSAEPAQARVRDILRFELAEALRQRLASLSDEDAERMLLELSRKSAPWLEAKSASWSYDEAREALILSAEGQAKPEWKGGEQSGRSLPIVRSAFPPLDKLERVKGEDQDIPWLTDFPMFSCIAVTTRLPPPRPGWAWTYFADPVDRKLGGIAFWRRAGIKDNVVRTVLSRRAYMREISGEDVKAHNVAATEPKAKPADAFEVEAGSTEDPQKVFYTWPFSDTTDWVADPSPCLGPLPTR